MIAVFVSRRSNLTIELMKESLPQRETLPLIALDFEERPLFSLNIHDKERAVAFHIDDEEPLITHCITLGFPSFSSPDVDADSDYLAASWEASFLAILEALSHRAVPRCSASSWIESFEMSYARRPSIADQLGARYAESHILDGEYQPGSGELIYDLENRTLLVGQTDSTTRGYFEIFPSAHPETLVNAVVFQSECWLSRFSGERFEAYYQGKIGALENRQLKSILSRAAREWVLANIVYLEKGDEIYLIQQRFDVADALHTSHHTSFVNALMRYAAHLEGSDPR